MPFLRAQCWRRDGRVMDDNSPSYSSTAIVDTTRRLQMDVGCPRQFIFPGERVQCIGDLEPFLVLGEVTPRYQFLKTFRESELFNLVIRVRG